MVGRLRRRPRRHLTHTHLRIPHTIILSVILLTLPVIVKADSTTFTVAASADDAIVIIGNEPTYPPTSVGAMVQIGVNRVGAARVNASGDFVIVNGFIRWDTSALPDNAVIESAALRCTILDNPGGGGDVYYINEDSVNLTADWYDAWPVDATDATAEAQTTALAGYPIAEVTPGQVSTFSLSNVSSVNPTGYTGIRLHLSGGQPTGFNIIVCASFDDGVHTPPELVVTYTVPAASQSSGGTFSPGFLALLPRTLPSTELPVLPAPTELSPAPTTIEPASSILRDLDLERAGITSFVALLGRLPRSDQDWTAVNHLAYGDRIERNVEAERASLVPFTRRFARVPQTAADWLIVHVLGFLSTFGTSS